MGSYNDRVADLYEQIDSLEAANADLLAALKALTAWMEDIVFEAKLFDASIIEIDRGLKPPFSKEEATKDIAKARIAIRKAEEEQR